MAADVLVVSFYNYVNYESWRLSYKPGRRIKWHVYNFVYIHIYIYKQKICL